MPPRTPLKSLDYFSYKALWEHLFAEAGGVLA